METVNVFVSHSEEDKAAAGALMRTLPEAGARGYSFLFTPLPPGVDFPSFLQKKINDAQIVVVLFSRFAMNSQWIPQEVRIAIHSRKIIIPVLLENLPLPMELARLQAIRAFEDPSGWVLQVRNAIFLIKNSFPKKKKGFFG